MAETRFWLIRHALVEEQARQYIYGTMDVHVCALTMEQQKNAYAALARRLPRPARWFVSPLSRTRRTAEAIFANGYPTQPLTVNLELTEQDFGIWQGLPHAEVAAKIAQPPHAFWPHSGDEKPPGGESIGEVITRIGEALETLARVYPGEDIVIVSHGGAIRGAVGHALDLRPDQALALSVQNISLTQLERHPTRWKVVCVNEAPGA